MTRQNLIERLSMKYYKLSSDEIEKAVKQLLRFMAESIEEGKRIEIRGFGVFTKKICKPSKVGNPKDGGTMFKENRIRIRFKPGKELKERVDKP